MDYISNIGVINMRLEVTNLCKSYTNVKMRIDVLDNVSASFTSGKFYLIKGESGAGKSTFLQILGTLDIPGSGTIKFEDKILNKMSSNELANFRYHNLGFIFQSFYLNPYLNAVDNVMLPMFLNKKMSNKDKKDKALELLDLVGLSSKVQNYPKELSGGEQQRVAIARCLANNPSIILADEPTGNLDSKNQKVIFDVLKKIAKTGKIVIVVSHSDAIKEYADVIYEMKDGVFINE